MTSKRKMIVNLLATLAFTALFLFPVMGSFGNVINADQTAQSAASAGDYVFFVVQNDEVPLAAAPSTAPSTYMIWIAIASLVMMVFFIYSAWYLSIRSNIRELSYKLSPAERRSLSVSRSFLHPIRCYQMAKETEDQVASLYINI